MIFSPRAAILIDTTSLSVTVLELPRTLTIKAVPAHFSHRFICWSTTCYLEHESVGRYLPSRRLLMAFKVVTCKVPTFITVIFEGRRGAKAKGLLISGGDIIMNYSFAAKVENCTLWLCFPA